jgi:hypothetical protein
LALPRKRFTPIPGLPATFYRSLSDRNLLEKLLNENMGNAAYSPCAVSRDKGAAQPAHPENAFLRPIKGVPVNVFCLRPHRKSLSFKILKTPDGLNTYQEARGTFPALAQVAWHVQMLQTLLLSKQNCLF